MKNHIKEVIYTLPQAPFSPTNIQRSMKNMRISKKTYKICHLYSAAGAFFPQKCKKSRKLEFQKEKNMKNHIKEVIYTLPQAPFSPTNVQQIQKNKRIYDKSYKIGHLYSTAGAFFPPKCSTNREK